MSYYSFVHPTPRLFKDMLLSLTAVILSTKVVLNIRLMTALTRQLHVTHLSNQFTKLHVNKT